MTPGSRVTYRLHVITYGAVPIVIRTAVHVLYAEQRKEQLLMEHDGPVRSFIMLQGLKLQRLITEARKCDFVNRNEL